MLNGIDEARGASKTSVFTNPDAIAGIPKRLLSKRELARNSRRLATHNRKLVHRRGTFAGIGLSMAMSRTTGVAGSAQER